VGARFPGWAQLVQQFNTSLQETSEDGTSWSADIQPWLGGEAGIAVTELDVTTPSSPEPVVVGYVESKDDAKAAALVTKTEGVQHLRLLDEAVSEMERERGMPVGSVGFGAMIEHPRALAEVNDIAERGPRVIAMMLGGEDFALETGSVPSDESLELPKRLVAFAAQAHGVAMIGILGTVADYSDPVAYKKSAERARRFGFSGGTCVHPGLVQALNEAFTPSADEAAYARKLIAADEEAAAGGRGSFTVDGKMIDIPVIDRARRLIARYDAIERRLKRA
jgi:citrate lyase subunit beta/citryl-CoA lyase